MDPIANMATIIRNGYQVRKKTVKVPYSRLKQELARKILKLGFLEKVEEDEKKRNLILTLCYVNNKPALSGIEKISKPSLRVYTGVKKIPRILGGRGEVLLSTPKGILTGLEAKKAKAGGELLLKIW